MIVPQAVQDAIMSIDPDDTSSRYHFHDLTQWETLRTPTQVFSSLTFDTGILSGAVRV